ncbi:MAG: RNA polymerase sigma factor [bacterium]|nr:RNA polymerase sigma factor [bacterium]
MLSKLSDAELIEGLRSGQNVEATWDELHSRYWGILAGFFGGRLDHTAEADDLVQATFIRALESLGSLKEGGSFRSWLFAIAANEWRNFRRDSARLKRAAPTLEIDADPWLQQVLPSSVRDPESKLDEQQKREAVYGAIDQLSPRRRQCLRLQLQGRSVDEISKLLQIAAGTVKANLFQARQQLAEQFGEH